MKLPQLLQALSIKDLLTIAGTDSEYINIQVSVFNAGAVITVECTDEYIEQDSETWNGTDTILDNNRDLRDLVTEELKNKLSVSTEEERACIMEVLKESFTCESWLNMAGTYEGYDIEINTRMPYVSIKHDSFENPDGWYFQGHEADNIITEINYIYNTVGCITAPDAVIKWAGNMLY
jgi:hypothetical protein